MGSTLYDDTAFGRLGELCFNKTYTSYHIFRPLNATRRLTVIESQMSKKGLALLGQYM
jgi:hypothetical protein